MLLIILLLYFHVTVSKNAQNFVNIYENKNGILRGITKNGSMIAFVTENYVIFGNLEDNFRFTNFNKIVLEPELSGTTELLEFKFVDENYLIICNKNGCCLFLYTVYESSCIKMPYKNTQFDSSNLRNFKIQKGRNELLFLRTYYSNYTLIQSHNFNSDGITPKGISLDEANGNYQRLFYSFIHANHIYFIDIVIRKNMNMKLSNKAEFYNNDIIITQICNNDESSDIQSRMDLVLSCEGIWYNDSKIIIKNKATAALYLSDTLLISIWNQRKGETKICKFNMSNVEKEFQKVWSLCHNSTENVNNCDNENVVNTCNNSAISSSMSSLNHLQYENTIYGKVIFDATDIDLITAIFPHNKNPNVIFALTKNGKLMTIPIDFSHLFAIQILDFNSELNQRNIIQWKEKAGFIFIHPSTKRFAFFKNATCHNKCHDKFLSSSITCSKCYTNASSSEVSCNFERRTICPPMLYIGKNRKISLDNNQGWSEFNEENGSKITECFKPSLADACSNETINDYLNPIFQLPYTFDGNEFSENKFWNLKTLLITFCLLLVAATCCSGLYLYYKNKKLSKRKKVHSSETQLEKFNKRYLIPGKNVELLELIGIGSTSEVNLANFTDNSSPIKVAVKTLKINAKKSDILTEIQHLSLCKHANIVTFIGWIDQEPYTCIITELMRGGDLHGYLKTHVLLLSTIFSYIFQVLDAMIYLSQKKILHRDLAARNCLLNENYKTLKLNDFGLSRKMNFDYQYISAANPLLPFKWLPLEALEPSTAEHKIFTLKGDIWSFGILIWELFERGSEPYDGMNFSATLGFLKSGFRLPQPHHCPRKLYEIMLRCWEKDQEFRPKFAAIKNDINHIFSQIQTTIPNSLNTPIELNSTIEEIFNENYVYQRP